MTTANRIDNHDGTVTIDGVLYVKDERCVFADYAKAVCVYADAEDGIDALIPRERSRPR